MEAVGVTPTAERWALLAAGSYCTADLAVHYFGLIEVIGSALHGRPVVLFFFVEFAFAVVGYVVVRRLWRIQRPGTIGSGLVPTALLIVATLFLAFNILFATAGILMKASGGS